MTTQLQYSEDIDERTTYLNDEDLAEYGSRLVRLRGLMRTAGLDGLIMADPVPGDTRWLTGYAGRPTSYTTDKRDWMTDRTGIQSPFEIKTYVVIPLTGEPTMMLDPGSGGNYAVAARRTSWIKRIFATTSEDPEWLVKYYWGHMTPSIEEDLARAIREAGLERAHIGILGTWNGIERTKARFPQAKFTPAVSPDPLDGVDRDFITLLMTTQTPYEIKQMKRASAAWEAGLLAFRAAATPGTRTLDAVNEARYAMGKSGCYDSWVLVGTGSEQNRWTWLPQEMQHPERRFQQGDMVNYCVHNQVGGYWIQSIRSWVLGGANKRQTHTLETAKLVYETAKNLIKPGTKGEEVWAACSEIAKARDVEFWGKLGHSEGPRGHDMDHRFDLLDRSTTPIPSGRALTIHPTCHDKISATSVYFGEAVIVEDDGCHTLSSAPPYID